MDDQWLIALSTSGATALVKAAATDAWQEIRSGFRQLFGRGDPDRERLAERRLDDAAAKVEQADDGTREDVRTDQIAVWRTRLADLLEEEPDQARALRMLIGRVAELLPDTGLTATDTGSVTTVNSGGVNIANSGVIRDVSLDGRPPRRGE